MIISASRRTDIPAFYAEWFIQRIRAGFCLVPNPYNRQQVARVSLLPQDVDVIVFWTRHPLPLLPYLDELDQRGYRYYFQYTLMDNPRSLELRTPPPESAIQAFRRLAERVGAQRLIWRYDPIVLTAQTDVPFHLEAYRRIADALQGATRRSVISVMDEYAKIRPRMATLTRQGITIQSGAALAQSIASLMPAMVDIASQHGMQIVSCAEELDLASFGVQPGKCVDDGYIEKVFGLQVISTKDPSQRQACGCVTSKDIGMYDSCTFGCQYCYATTSFQRAGDHYARHDPQGEMLYPLETGSGVAAPHPIHSPTEKAHR